MQITMIAIIMTRIAATTGTTKFKFDNMMRMASSAVNSGIPRDGGIVPETTERSEQRSIVKHINNKMCLGLKLAHLLFMNSMS